MPTPAWIVPVDGGRVGFWTASTTGKVKRLAHTPRVELQPSDSRGRPEEGTAPVAATAAVVTDGPDFDTVTRRIKAKYGAMRHVAKWLARVGALVKRRPFADADRVVVITPD